MPFLPWILRLKRPRVAICSLLLSSAALISCRAARPTLVPNIHAPPIVVPASARTNLALTLYSLGGEGYAFVREERKVHLAAGHFTLRADGIATGIVPETTRFELVSVDDEGKVDSAADLYEQRYLYDRLGPARLLEKAVGQRVSVTYPAGARSGKENQVIGTVLASKQGTLIRTDRGEVLTVPDNARISFSALPPDLVERPTLSWNAGAFEETDALLRFSYRANNFTWHADYVVALDKGEKFADVEGWISVTNLGDASFEKAKLQLVAGTVHTLESPRPHPRFSMKRDWGAAKSLEDSRRTVEESLGELHLYTINEPSDLPSKSSKQVRFVVARSVPATIEAEAKAALEDGEFVSMLTLKLEHKDNAVLCVPLPGGTARTNALGSQGQPVNIGEGSTIHSPVGEVWRVPVAVDANQITRIRVKENKLIGRERTGEAHRRMSMEVELRNTGERSRSRRVAIEPGSYVLLSAEGSPIAKLDGPKRLVIETDLAAGANRLITLTIEYLDTNDVEHDSGALLSPESSEE